MKAWFLIVCLFVAGCGGGVQTTTVPGRFGSLAFGLTSNKAAYVVGESVTFTLTVTNVGPEAVSIEHTGTLFRDNEMLFVNADWKVSSGQTTVWQCYPGCGILPPLIPGPPPVTLLLQPVTSIRVNATWIQSSNFSLTPAPPGTYTVAAWFRPLSIDGRTFSASEMETLLSAAPITVTVQ